MEGLIDCLVNFFLHKVYTPKKKKSKSLVSSNTQEKEEYIIQQTITRPNSIVKELASEILSDKKQRVLERMDIKLK